jgi:O-antigen/teichoic acid export membrane protein
LAAQFYASRETFRLSISVDSTAANGWTPVRLLRSSWPYGLNGAFYLVYNRLDVVLVSIFAGASQAGVYAPASRIQDALFILPITATVAVVPIAAQQFGRDHDVVALRRTAMTALGLSLCLTLPAVIFVFLTADDWLPRVLGEDYQGSVEPLQIIIWSLLFVAIASPFFSVIVAAGRPQWLNYAYGGAFAFAFIGHALIDPNYGATGAAAVSMLRDVVGCGIGMFIAFRLFRGPVAVGEDDIGLKDFDSARARGSVRI